MTDTAPLSPQVFAFESHAVRCLGTAERPEWIARDVCDALGLVKVDRALGAIPTDEKGAHTLSTPGGPQKVSTVTEAGLYRLIFRSTKPAAERFRRWIFAEVLPSIRKTGAYAAPMASALPTPLPAREQLELVRDAAELVRTLSRPGLEAGERSDFARLARSVAIAACAPSIPVARDLIAGALPAALPASKAKPAPVTAERVAEARSDPDGDHVPPAGASRAAWICIEDVAEELRPRPARGVLVRAGVLAARAWTEAHGHDPAKAPRAVMGDDGKSTLRQGVNIYPPDAHAGLLDAIRTAQLTAPDKEGSQ